jgi:hypothetical protein
MADAVTVEINSVAFEAAMQRLRRGVISGFIDPVYGTLPKQASLLAKRCQDFTPPRNVGQGKAAVARDLSVIFRPLDQRTFEDKRLRKIIREDNRPAWDAAARNFRGGHNLRNTQAIPFSAEWHQRNRTRRGRAVAGKGGNIGVVTLGPSAKAARTYMKTIQGRVGWARAGWNAGIVGFGGAISAGWISKHGTVRGQAIDGRSSSDPFVRVINDTGWAKYGKGEGNRILRNAINARARDMESYVNRQMRLAAAKAMSSAA